MVATDAACSIPIIAFAFATALRCSGFTTTSLLSPTGGAYYRSYECNSYKSRHSDGNGDRVCSTLLPLYIIVNSFFRGVLRIIDEAQRVCNVKCTAIIGRL